VSNSPERTYDEPNEVGGEIRIFCEVMAGLPLWGAGGPLDEEYARDRLGLSEELVADLLAWDEDYQSGRDALDQPAWIRRGRALADRVQDVVGPRVHVEYQEGIDRIRLELRYSEAGGLPLWSKDGQVAPAAARTLGLDDDMVEELRAWAEGHPQGGERVEPAAWVARGRELADRLHGALGRYSEVRYVREGFGDQIVLRWELGRQLPLWDLGGSLDEEDLRFAQEQLALSHDLIGDLVAWSYAESDRRRFGGSAGAPPDAWVRRGEELAERLRVELPAYTVTYVGSFD
jgi:hypothetical protein